MTRSAATILKSLIGRITPGWVLSARDGYHDAVLEAAAHGIADAEDAAAAVMDEIDPRQARYLLEDFERVLGPDRCGRDLNSSSLSERQALAHQRWTASGGQSIPYMISTAAKLNTEIEVEEFWPSVSGGLRTGQRLIADGEQFLYLVRLDATDHTEKFRTGASSAGDFLGTFTVSSAECELRRIKPAHTTIVFSYVDYITFLGERLMFMGEPLYFPAD